MCITSLGQSCNSVRQNASSRRTLSVPSPVRDVNRQSVGHLSLYGQDSGVLGCDVEWVVEWYSKFRRIVVPCSSSGPNILEYLTLRKKAIKSTETSEPVIHRHSVPLQRNMNSQQHSCKNLQFLKVQAVRTMYLSLTLEWIIPNLVFNRVQTSIGIIYFFCINCYGDL